MPYNVRDLIALTERKKCKYLFFWGHKQQRSNVVNETCLSQWYPSPFSLTTSRNHAERYATAEHFMMVQKAILFGAHDISTQILQDDDPAKAKALGRQIPNFDPELWDGRKFYIVVAGNELKFSQNDHLRAFLLATGKRILVEASPNDRVWGIGMTQDHPDASNPSRWKGENQLGFALMKVRDQIFKNRS